VREEAAELRDDAEHGKKVRGNASAMDAHGIAQPSEVLDPIVVSGELIEGLHAGLGGNEVRGGEHVCVEKGRMLRGDIHEPTGIRIRQRAKEQSVDSGEDGGGGADAEA
jgi:hypothetical protein